MASAVSKAGVLKGEVVSVMVPNVPIGVTCHFAIPGMGSTLHMINTRLDAKTVAFQVTRKRRTERAIVCIHLLHVFPGYCNTELPRVML